MLVLHEANLSLERIDQAVGLYRTAIETPQVGHSEATAARHQRQQLVEQIDDDSALPLHIRQQESHGTHDKKQSEREGEHGEFQAAVVDVLS
ncbi:MAG: hypothetical protein VCF24_29765 [Candidatus Latescibacterota bacterium]